jgi:hypothetical protein
MARFLLGVSLSRRSLIPLVGLLTSVVLSAVAPADAQVQPNIENGFKSNGSYDSSKIDTVNLGNGGLTLHIPLPLAYPQRGGKLDRSYFLVSNSKSWQVQYYFVTGQQPVYYWNYGPAVGSSKIGEDPGTLGPYLTATSPQGVQRHLWFQTDNNGNDTELASDYSIRDWDGSVHLLVDVSGGQGTSFASADTTAFHVAGSNPDEFGVPTTLAVTDRKGTVSQVSFPAQWPPCTRTTVGGTGGTTTVVCNGGPFLQTFTDANGNVYGSQDTLGRSLPLGGTPSSDTSGCVSSVPLTGSMLYGYTGLSGAGTAQDLPR